MQFVYVLISSVIAVIGLTFIFRRWVAFSNFQHRPETVAAKKNAKVLKKQGILAFQIWFAVGQVKIFSISSIKDTEDKYKTGLVEIRDEKLMLTSNGQQVFSSPISSISIYSKLGHNYVSIDDKHFDLIFFNPVDSHAGGYGSLFTQRKWLNALKKAGAKESRSFFGA